MTYTIHALPADVLDRMRGPDAALTVEAIRATGRREPLRCCLRNALEGEALLLAGYEPPLPDSPYVEKGAVFIHREPCDGPADGYPEDWAHWPQVLRAYDERGWIHPATSVHDGTDPEAAIAAILEHPTVERIHSRNVAYGCYMFEIRRAG